MRGRKLLWGIIGLFVLINIFIWSTIVNFGSDLLTVAFLDVGQGDAIFIESPTGVQVLIDGGRGSGVLRDLSTVMPFYDRSIDVVLATHPDADHVAGLVDVLRRFSVERIIESGVVHDAKDARAFSQAASVEGAIQILARRGQVFDLGGGVLLTVLFPDRDVENAESNSASIVARLTYGEHSFIFTGDAPQNIEKYIVELEGQNLQSDVLKLGHHGSKTSSSEIFLGFVNPEYGIISAGENNRYGHPHKEVLERLTQFDIPVLSTAREGTIVFESDGTFLRVR